MLTTRMNRVMKELERMELTQMIIVDPLSIYYLTGVQVAPGERFLGVYLNKAGKKVFFVNKLFTIPANLDAEVVWYSDTDPVMDWVAEQVDPSCALGVDKDMRARFLLPIMEAHPQMTVKNASLAVDLTRGQKDGQEKEKMREASRINDQAMAKFPTLIHEGVREKEVAEQMLNIYLELGADGFSFEPIVSFGANAADPHHMPDDTVLKDGDCVLFDVGCKKDGYCSDMTRTFYYKSADETSRKIYEIVKQANEAAEAIIKPGVPLCELDKAARNLITEAGYGPQFTHRLGHFIGLDEHEFGDVSSVSDWIAAPGMIFSIEPGIYLEGNTGVRIEDLVLVTEDGCEVLNHYSKELKILFD